MGVFLNMTEKQEKSKESIKDDAARYFAEKIAGSKNYDNPFYYLWSEFLGGLALVSFKFWIMYLTNEEGFREGLEDSPKAIIDAVLQMWRVRVISEIDKEMEKHEEMMKTPYAKIFGNLMTPPDEARKEIYKTIEEVEAKARQALYDGIVVAVDKVKTE